MTGHKQRARRRVAGWAVGALALFLAGLWVGQRGERAGPPGPRTQAPGEQEHQRGHQHGHGQASGAVVAEEVRWTCSMHPQIQQPEFGTCPLCGMDLIPAESGGEHDAGGRQLTLSEYARKLAEVETTPVERRFVTREIRMVGKVAFDETRVTRISAWMPGRIERLYVDFTGVAVREGEHLLELYSPELLTAQEELLQAGRLPQAAQPQGAFAERSSQANLAAAREKLRLLGLAPDQIAAIETGGEPSERITIRAPMSGIVVGREAVAGGYVQTGSPLYTLADLSRVWVLLDAYERDLAWIRYGQEVELTMEAYPGERFAGRISFIDPVVDPRSRTIKVRVNVDNVGGKLKPDMFARGLVRAQIGAHGRVRDPALAGKWISPMHPEIVKDGPGACDVCGMPLVPAEELGYAGEGRGEDRGEGRGEDRGEGRGERHGERHGEDRGEDRGEAPLVIPVSAALVTGERAVVYVADPHEEGRYAGREIVLGPRAGSHYIVRDGLSEGDRVVSKGNFKIDSAIQIVAGPSMMNPAGGGGRGDRAPAEDQPVSGPDAGTHGMQAVLAREAMETPEAFRQALSSVYAAYFAVQTALSLDDHATAVAEIETVIRRATALGGETLAAQAAGLWREDRERLLQIGRELAASEAIEPARRLFESLSHTVAGLVRSFGSAAGDSIYRYHCPMAFDWKGADWLQDRSGTENPYFGSAMYKCGTEEEILWPPATDAASTGTPTATGSGTDAATPAEGDRP